VRCAFYPLSARATYDSVVAATGGTPGVLYQPATGFTPHLRRRHPNTQAPGNASNQRSGLLPNPDRQVNPIKHAFRNFTSERPSHPPPRTRRQIWTQRRKRGLSKGSCPLTRIMPRGCWIAWGFLSRLRENESTLKSRRGFCSLNRNFQIIGYPSIKCEYV